VDLWLKPVLNPLTHYQNKTSCSAVTGINDRNGYQSTFAIICDRMSIEAMAGVLLMQAKRRANAQQMLSHSHFSKDGTLINASASMMSFVSNKPTNKNVLLVLPYRGEQTLL